MTRMQQKYVGVLEDFTFMLMRRAIAFQASGNISGPYKTSTIHPAKLFKHVLLCVGILKAALLEPHP